MENILPYHLTNWCCQKSL